MLPRHAPRIAGEESGLKGQFADRLTSACSANQPPAPAISIVTKYSVHDLSLDNPSIEDIEIECSPQEASSPVERTHHADQHVVDDPTRDSYPTCPGRNDVGGQGGIDFCCC